VERKTLASLALMFAIGTFLLWGMTNFLIGYGEKNLRIDPNMFTAIMWITMGGLGAALLVYLWLTNDIGPLGSNIVYPVAAGACLGIGILSFVYAMSHTDMSTGATAAVATSNAIFTTMLAFLILREQMTVKEWIGIATVVAGIIILRI
jgi:drug/metabolite transporter (DMT)-like permease